MSVYSIYTAKEFWKMSTKLCLVLGGESLKLVHVGFVTVEVMYAFNVNLRLWIRLS